MSDRLKPRRWTSTLREIGLDRDAGEADLVDALGVRRLRFRRSSDRHRDAASGNFVVMHRALVRDPTRPPNETVEVWSATSRDAALAEALGRFLVEHPRRIAGPAGRTGLLGTGPLGTGPLGAGPLGTGPLGTGPLGTGPLGSGLIETVHPGTARLRTDPRRTGSLDPFRPRPHTRPL
jgi:hypothetical protein